MYLSGLISIILFPIRKGILSPTTSAVIGCILLVPGGIDGTTQMLGNRESTNQLRVITGTFMGIGIVLFAEGFLFTLLSI